MAPGRAVSLYAQRADEARSIAGHLPPRGGGPVRAPVSPRFSHMPTSSPPTDGSGMAGDKLPTSFSRSLALPRLAFWGSTPCG